ncbi:MAG: EAL domain-containing protein [Coprobacillus sp.]
MKKVHESRKSNLFLCFVKISMIFLVCFVSFSFSIYFNNVSAYNTDKVVRVGFFDFEGYHETDNQNQRSGYGYEYLHEMAKYTGWVFQYVDGTWEECQQMLKDGKIDLLTSAQYSEARDKLFDFSSTSMGTSYAQLTVADGNYKYGRNDFNSFQGIKVGLLKGNSRNDRLQEFAKEKGFSYQANLYDTQDQLDSALKSGEVDAILTSSLRKLKNERIIAQFAPSPFYAIVKEGNQTLLDEVNLALETIEMNSPAFKYNLYQEYYHIDTTDTFILSREEKEYLATNPTIRAVIRTGVEPISYWEDNKYKGISADVIDYIFKDLGIKVEYIKADSLEVSYQKLSNGNADIACMFESDYNLAEQYNTRITAPYLSANYSVVSKKQSNQSSQSTKAIAIVDGELMGTRYAKSHYPSAKIVSVTSNKEAIESVSNGLTDMAFVNVYATEADLINYPGLRASFISDDEQQFSVGVSQKVNSCLYSILDKKINSIDSEVLSDILSKHTMFNQTSMSLTDYFQQNPFFVIFVSLFIFTAIIGILLYIMFINKKHAKSIHRLAYTDELTNLYNLNGFLLQGNALLLKKTDFNFAVIAVNLSCFSNVNENYGRPTGDSVIQNMGTIINSYHDEYTVVAHSDADHFLMLLSYSNQDELNRIVDDVQKNLSTYVVDELYLHFTVFIGVGFVEKGEEALLKAIDYARVAQNKCNQEHTFICMDDSLKNSLIREKEISDHVLLGLENGEFEVYYQPKIDMINKKIVGAEALIRWNHQRLGFLSPMEFIPILEKNGTVTDIDFFVLEQSCKMVRNWLDSGQKAVIISVNQSRAHFLKDDYLDKLREIINKYKIPPGCIELEITETLFGQEAISNAVIKEMKDIGLLISIDDFGSGYSSLYLLHQISVDILKIDKGLLDEGDKYEKVRNIIRRIVQIASDLDIEVICEGVETQEQVDFLLGIQCQYAQGFLFSKPLPRAEFELYVQKNS